MPKKSPNIKELTADQLHEAIQVLRSWGWHVEARRLTPDEYKRQLVFLIAADPDCKLPVAYQDFMALSMMVESAYKGFMEPRLAAYSEEFNAVSES